MHKIQGATGEVTPYVRGGFHHQAHFLHLTLVASADGKVTGGDLPILLPPSGVPSSNKGAALYASRRKGFAQIDHRRASTPRELLDFRVD